MIKISKTVGYVLLYANIICFLVAVGVVVFFGASVNFDENWHLTYEIGGHPGRLEVTRHNTVRNIPTEGWEKVQPDKATQRQYPEI